MNFAVINNGIVENIILAETQAIAEEVTGLTCIEYTSDNPAHIGFGYNGIIFEQPIIIEKERDE
jgi:hypothetical protein